MALRELLIGDVAGPVAVVVPHPDDESLGCGGLLALLARSGVPVVPILVSDGAASHPGSLRWPPERLAEVRRSEFREALACLGLDGVNLVSLGLPDGSVPHRGDAGFDGAAMRLTEALDAIEARTVIAPWRRDAHADHRASHGLAREALRRRRLRAGVRLLEYAVWDERAAPHERPEPGEAIEWRLDIAPVRAAKAAAIDAHRSQCGLVVDDAPHGFVLPPAMRDRAAGPTERYWEVTG